MLTMVNLKKPRGGMKNFTLTEKAFEIVSPKCVVPVDTLPGFIISREFYESGRFNRYLDKTRFTVLLCTLKYFLLPVGISRLWYIILSTPLVYAQAAFSVLLHIFCPDSESVFRIYLLQAFVHANHSNSLQVVFLGLFVFSHDFSFISRRPRV